VGVGDGDTHELRPGVLYCPDQGEAHFLRAESELQLICVFSPPLKGSESHSAGGKWQSSY
jgi:L-ectoine synthase